MTDKQRALVIGSNGVIGQAIVAQLQASYELYTLSRGNCDFTDETLATKAVEYRQQGSFDLIICCVGVLHNERLQPEKRLSQLNADRLSEYFLINSILPALCIKHFAGLLNKTKPSVFLTLSAMVGSISDNKLGGWYGYRASKAALNMLVKTASIEIARQNKLACIASVHPGTTQGKLSKPFSSRVAPSNYYSPEQSANRIIELSTSLNAELSGGFFNWDTSQIPW